MKDDLANIFTLELPTGLAGIFKQSLPRALAMPRPGRRLSSR